MPAKKTYPRTTYPKLTYQVTVKMWKPRLGRYAIEVLEYTCMGKHNARGAAQKRTGVEAILDIKEKV